jgi:hypothetical protein
VRSVHSYGYAVTEQVAVAGTNFLVSLCMARLFAQDVYGLLSCILSISLLWNLIVNCFIVKSLIIKSSAFSRGCPSKTSVAWTAVIYLIVGVGLALATVFLLRLRLRDGFAIALAFLPLGLFWLLRRATSERGGGKARIAGVVLFIVMQAGVIGLVAKSALLSPALVMLASSLCYMPVLASLANQVRIVGVVPSPGKVTAAVRVFLGYGMSVFPSSVYAWLLFNLPFSLVLIGLSSESVAAEARYYMNFSLPLLHVVIALLNPGMAWLRARGRTAGLARPARRLFWLVLAATSLYGAALYGLREPVFRIAYGGHVRPEPLPALLVAVFVPLQIVFVTLSSFAKARDNLRLVRRATYATCPILLIALFASDGFGSVASIFVVADLMLLLTIACMLPALGRDTERAASITLRVLPTTPSGSPRSARAGAWYPGRSGSRMRRAARSEEKPAGRPPEPESIVLGGPGDAAREVRQRGGTLLAAASHDAQPSRGDDQATPAPPRTECDNCHGAPAHIRIVSPAPDGRGPP